VKPFNGAQFDFVRAALAADCVTVTVTICGGAPKRLGQEIVVSADGPVLGTFGEKLDAAAVAAAQQAMHAGQSALSTLAGETLEVFLDVTAPPLEIIMVGGVHIAVTLAQLARAIGYRTVVIDPRETFGSPERFPQVDRLIRAWPKAAFEQVILSPLSAVVMLTHDPKLDDPALKIALPSPAFYVGALGSRKTQTERRERLLAAGLSEDQVNQLYGPVGLALGGQAPEEIALAILAQIVQVRNQSARTNTLYG
jgi:xanthine dehydrogenase accessory factor